MSGNKYVSVGSGGDFQEVAASQTSAGSGSAGNIVALNGSGLIDTTMLPGEGATTMTASEAIAAGALINVWNSSGALKVRNANASGASTRAHGYAPAAIGSGSSGTVVFGDADITGLSGLTLGSQYFLDDVTAGNIVTGIPTTTNHIVQPVGIAKSATELQMRIGPVTVRA